jgi:hypothetical protein
VLLAYLFTELFLVGLCVWDCVCGCVWVWVRFCLTAPEHVSVLESLVKCPGGIGPTLATGPPLATQARLGSRGADPRAKRSSRVGTGTRYTVPSNDV